MITRANSRRVAPRSVGNFATRSPPPSYTYVKSVPSGSTDR